MSLNRLHLEKSPYLLQHKENPVHWYPWGEEAFAAARRENKPIFLSIGYSTCYWCHVMEKDSFEREEVAEVLNKYYVSIKLDREERPDVDTVYMDAVVGMTGQGGWPMSVFLTPNLEPFWGGTFFYRDQFISILRQVHEAWIQQPEKILESGKGVTQFLQERGLSAVPKAEIGTELFTHALAEFGRTFDPVYGGFGPAPKFPPSAQVSLLLRIHLRTSSADALHMAVKTLEMMARGGIYDHLGGGFARYSTDERWLVPHFEKMLYDNALLAVSYLEAYQSTQDNFYLSVARETLDYVLRDMTDSAGGFYSAEDAGEVGKEGEYYVWPYAELEKILDVAELELAATIYGISKEGNFEHNNVLNLQRGSSWEVKQSPAVQALHRKLLAERIKRKAPHKDDKILTSWNGLMITALAKGTQVSGDTRYLAAAQRCAAFLKDKVWRDGRLLRRYRDGEAKFSGCADDYACLIEGLLALYEADFDLQWLEWAFALQRAQDEIFWDTQGGGYFYSEAAEVIVKKKELIDGATPSANSISLGNLLRLHSYAADSEIRKKINALTALLSGALSRYPAAFPKTLQALDFEMSEKLAVVIAAESTVTAEEEKFVRILQAEFFPHKVLARVATDQTSDPRLPPLLQYKTMLDGKPTVYLCEGLACKQPLTDFSAAAEVVRS